VKYTAAVISSKDTVKEAILKAKSKKVFIEGNFVKLLAKTSDPEVKEYIQECKKKDLAQRRKRLDITKQVQAQNRELEEAAVVNKALLIDLENKMEELEISKKEAEGLRDEALNDLEVMQKKTQFELISIIVKLALAVIVGVGVTTSVLYMFVLYQGYDSKIIESTWSNLFGILLTNSFSIVGTIMGVKYATEKE
jgi:hypothetical protein